MKSKKSLLVCLLLSVVMLTGCTQYMKTDNVAVKNPDTGQSVVSNILCKTSETEETYKKIVDEKKKEYKELLDSEDITKKEYKQKVKDLEKQYDLEKLPYCKNLGVLSGGYEGLWTTFFVKPLAWILVKTGNFVKNYGLAVIIITFLIRLIMYPVTRSTAMQSENLKKIQPELERLEKKYRGKENDQQAMMIKSQEMMMLYKQYNINPFSSCLFSLIQIPLFFAFFEALNRLPIIFEGNLGPLTLGMTPGVALADGKYYYLIIVVLVVATTYFSFKLNSGASMSKEQADQMKMMMNVMIVMISISSFTVATSIALYWITNSAFTIFQNLIVKRGKKKNA